MGRKDGHRLIENSVPEGWKRVRLGDVADPIMGQSPPGSTVVDWDGDPHEGRGLPFIQGNAEFGTQSPLPVKWCFRPLKRVQSGDVLLSVRAPVGEINRATCSISIGRGLAALRFTDIDPNFGWHMMNHSRRGFDRLTQGSTFEAIGRPVIIGLPILLPPLPEQRAIAAVLDSIDEATERTEAVIAATEQLRGSLLHELLTRGVPGWHTEWKDVPGLGSIPADWDVVRLGDVAAVERGKFAHRPRNEPRFYGGSIPFIQTGDVVQANGRIKEHSQTLNELGLSISRLFPTGTIVITIAANIGETAITDYPVAFPDSLVGIIPTAIDRRFLEYFLRTQKTRLSQFAPESAQKNINLEDLRPLSTPVPSQREQTAIAAALDGVEDLIEQARVERETRQALKESASEALLTGRVRVKDYNPYPEPGEIVC